MIKDDLLARRVALCRACNSEEDLRPKKIRRKKKKKKRTDGWESDEPEETVSYPAGIMKVGRGILRYVHSLSELHCICSPI